MLKRRQTSRLTQLIWVETSPQHCSNTVPDNVCILQEWLRCWAVLGTRRSSQCWTWTPVKLWIATISSEVCLHLEILWPTLWIVKLVTGAPLGGMVTLNTNVSRTQKNTTVNRLDITWERHHAHSLLSKTFCYMSDNRWHSEKTYDQKLKVQTFMCESMLSC